MKALHTGLVRYVITCLAIVAGLAAPARRRAARRSRRRAVFPLRRRRRGHQRPVGAGAQEHRRARVGVRQPLHRHGVLRVHRRGDLGEPVRRRAHAVEPLGGLPARQVDVHARLREQRRKRLHRQDHVRRHQSRHVRRSHHRRVRLQERRERSFPQPERPEHRRGRERPEFRRDDGYAELQRLRVADHHQEPGPRRPVRSHHR